MFALTGSTERQERHLREGDKMFSYLGEEIAARACFDLWGSSTCSIVIFILCH